MFRHWGRIRLLRRLSTSEEKVSGKVENDKARQAGPKPILRFKDRYIRCSSNTRTDQEKVDKSVLDAMSGPVLAQSY